MQYTTKYQLSQIEAADVLNAFTIYNADMQKIDTALGQKARIVVVPYGQDLPEAPEEGAYYLKTMDAAGETVALFNSSKEQLSVAVKAESVMVGEDTLDEVLEGLAPDTLASGTQKGLMSAEDFQKLQNIQAGAQVNTVTSVEGRTGAVTIGPEDIFQNGVTPIANGGHGGTNVSAGLENMKLKKNGYGEPQSAALQYEYLSAFSFFIHGMTTKAFLESMPAHSSIIAIGNEQANFSDAPVPYGLYHFIKGSNDNYMVGKCYGIGQSGEYFYAWSTTNGNGLGWVKNAKTGDLSAYVQKAGLSPEDYMTGSMYLGSTAKTSLARLACYFSESANQDYLNLSIVDKAAGTSQAAFNLYEDGRATINSQYIMTRANVNQTLWTGSWSSGNISVPGFSDYSVFEITFDEKATKALLMKHGGYLRGMGGFSSSANSFMILGFGATFSGNTLTFGYAAERNIIADTQTELTVTSIVGIV